MSQKYLVIAVGYMGRICKAGEVLTSQSSLPRASWYKPQEGSNYLEDVSTAEAVVDTAKDEAEKVEAQADVKPPEEPTTQTGDAQADQSRKEALHTAFMTLDPSDEDIWTLSGKPNLNVLNGRHDGDDFKAADLTEEYTLTALIKLLADG